MVYGGHGTVVVPSHHCLLARREHLIAYVTSMAGGYRTPPRWGYVGTERQRTGIKDTETPRQRYRGWRSTDTETAQLPSSSRSPPSDRPQVETAQDIVKQLRQKGYAAVGERTWLEEWEQKVIQAFCRSHPDAGYRRLTYMMTDADVVAVSPSSVYRVLKRADLLNRWPRKAPKKGKGFHPSAALDCAAEETA